jgi:plastocyanin
MQHRMAAASLWLALAGFTGLGAASAGEAAHTIVVKDFMFAPVNLKIKAGTQVTWTNKDEEPHTVSSNEGTFRSFALDTNDTFSYKFDKPGTYRYTCTIHPRMTGTIVVE